MMTEEYININKIAEIKGLTSNRSLRLAIQKGKYIAREVKVFGGTSYEILYSSLEPEVQEKLQDELIKEATQSNCTALVPLDTKPTYPTFIAESAKLTALARVDVVKALQNIREKYKTKKEADSIFLDLYNSGMLLPKVPMARYAKPLMNEGATITALTYLGSVRAVCNYNIMGVAKAALESTVRYLAYEFGKDGIRVNALSAGPVKTLAAKGIGDFDTMLKVAAMKAPLRRNVALEDVGKAGLYLASDMSSGVTGEVHYVDCGFNIMGVSEADAGLVKQ